MRLLDKLKTRSFRVAESIELRATRIRGKGYGAGSINLENEQVHRVLGRTPELAVDIGANIGNYTAELRRRSPLLEIHSFEPAAINVGKMRLRFGGDERVVIVPLAVSDKSGSTTLYSNESGSGLGSLARRRLEHFDIPFDVTENINTIRFEDYWRERLGGRRVDIAKLDIEGYELAALSGFGEAICSVSVVQFEFGGCNIDTRTYFQDFWYYFKQYDFDLFRITPIGLEKIEKYRESDEFFSTTNYISVNKNLVHHLARQA